jgi:fatty acid synthase, animal type
MLHASIFDKRMPHADKTKHVFAIPGIADPSTMIAETTLAELGVDSLGSVEIKQLLEQKYSVLLASSKDIQQLTIKRLKEIDAASSVLSLTNTASLVTSSIRLAQLLPQDLVVTLNDKHTSDKYPNLFIIHPIEGHVEIFRELAQLLPMAVYGFQWTLDVPDRSIEEIAAFYIQVCFYEPTHSRLFTLLSAHNVIVREI